jgi:transposase
MASRGRPTKLTPEVTTHITDAIHAGNYLDTAAAYAGISKVTLHAWLKRGRKEKTGKYRNFVNAVEKALARFEVQMVVIIAREAQKDWRPAAWMLERKFASRWGRRVEPGSNGSRSGSKRPWRAKLEAKNPEPMNPEPMNPEPMNPEPMNPEPMNPEPMNPEPMNPEPMNP